MQDDYIYVYNSPMLNYKWFFVFILLSGLLFMAAGVKAQSPSLYTKDGSCRYYYFTPKNTQSWYITATDGLCDDGVVDGQGAVTVYNAFSQPIEQIYGFFNEGFWTGDMPLSAPVLYQTVEPDSTQKVYFQIPNDTYYNFQLIGQMSSQKQKDGTYEAFKFCGPFRILLQTEESDLFTDDKKLIEIVDGLVKKTREYCPAEETLYFYASRLERPNLDDIFFFAEVDLRAARITIKRNVPPEKNPSDSLASGMPTQPNEDLGVTQNYSDGYGHGFDTNFADNLSGAPAQNAASYNMNNTNNMAHTANMQSAAQSRGQTHSDTYPRNGISEESQTFIDLRNNSPKFARSNHTTQAPNRSRGEKKQNKSEQPTKDKKLTSSADKNALAGLSEKNNVDKQQLNVKNEQEIDKVPHLLLSSKIMRKPVAGTAVVYISDVMEDSGRSNKPNPLKLEGQNLSIGWAVISGDFEYQSTSSSGKLRGKVLVKSALPCQSKMCKDIK